MSDAAEKFLPRPGAESLPYWQGCNEERLLLQRCDGCGHWQFYPRILCTACGGARLSFEAASGWGRVKSFTVIRIPITPAYEALVPYVVALIELDEGPTMMSHVITSEVDALRIGDRVEATFQQWSEDQKLPVFHPCT